MKGEEEKLTTEKKVKKTVKCNIIIWESYLEEESGKKTIVEDKCTLIKHKL